MCVMLNIGRFVLRIKPAEFTVGTAGVCVRGVSGEIQMCVGNNRRDRSNALIPINHLNSGINNCLTLWMIVSEARKIVQKTPHAFNNYLHSLLGLFGFCFISFFLFFL